MLDEANALDRFLGCAAVVRCRAYAAQTSNFRGHKAGDRWPRRGVALEWDFQFGGEHGQLFEEPNIHRTVLHRGAVGFSQQFPMRSLLSQLRPDLSRDTIRGLGVKIGQHRRRAYAVRQPHRVAFGLQVESGNHDLVPVRSEFAEYSELFQHPAQRCFLLVSAARCK